MSGDALVEQLAEAEDHLGQFGAATADPLTGDLSVRLFCSWMPQDGQHAISLSPGLARALAGVDGAFWMDVYRLFTVGVWPGWVRRLLDGGLGPSSRSFVSVG